MRLNEKYNEELMEQDQIWHKKKLLRAIYKQFYLLINTYVKRKNLTGSVVEIGSGISKIKEIIADCVCTSPNETRFCDKIENAYNLSFENSSISNLILFDVFHHIRYPGDALDEFNRVLENSGRLIIFEPCMSVLGIIVYGLFHDEPIALTKTITWKNDNKCGKDYQAYYAAQGNASRIFDNKNNSVISDEWNVITIKKLSAISYIASGGYSMKQLYPTSFLPLMKYIDKVSDLFPILFATRMLVILEKK